MVNTSKILPQIHPYQSFFMFDNADLVILILPQIGL